MKIGWAILVWALYVALLIAAIYLGVVPLLETLSGEVIKSSWVAWAGVFIILLRSGDMGVK